MSIIKKAVAGILVVALVVANITIYEKCAMKTVVAEETISSVISGETEWNYLDTNVIPDTGWNVEAEYNVSTWKKAKGSFGAKNGVIADLGSGYIPNTLLNQYIDGTSNDIPIYYFRTTFDLAEVKNLEDIDLLSGSVIYDDAAIVYINGEKVGAFDADSFDANGYGGSNAGAPKTGEIHFTDISKLNLKDTGNVLAVEIHQGRASSSDIYFDMTNLMPVLNYEVNYDIKNISLDIGTDETQRNLVWYTNSKEDTNVKVAVKPEGWIGEMDFPQNAVTYSAESVESNISGYTTNKAEIKNLKENTEYIYQISAGTTTSKVYSFSTSAFGKDENFNFLLAGDPQIGASGNSSNDTLGWTTTLNRAITAFPESSFLLSAGDQINDKDSREEIQYEGFLAPEVLKSLPVAVNVGNHDSGSKKYTEHFAMPNVSVRGASNGTGEGSGDYWFIYNGVLIMSINSNNMSTAEHKAFLEETLEAQGENARWKIVTFHHSIYSVANHATDGDIITRRNELSQVFSDLGIDVVLMGHDHYYTRTYLMEGTVPVVPKGNDISKGEEAAKSVIDPEDGQVLYVTANSASGSKYYGFNSNASTGYVAVQDQSNRETISNVEITENALTITTYYADQEELQEMDRFTIVHTPADTEAPVITLPDDSRNTIYIGDEFNVMDGVFASDVIDGDLTDSIKVIGKVDTSQAGIYTLKYEVTDKAGNVCKVTRTVIVLEKKIEQPSTNNTSTKNQTTQKESKVTVARTKIKSVTSKKKVVNIKYKKIKGATKYQIRWSKSKNFKKYKTVTTKKLRYTFKKFKKMKKGHKVYFRVRAVKVVNGKAYKGKWSIYKKVVIK